eukprot:gene6407-286_t
MTVNFEAIVVDQVVTNSSKSCLQDAEVVFISSARNSHTCVERLAVLVGGAHLNALGQVLYEMLAGF